MCSAVEEFAKEYAAERARIAVEEANKKAAEEMALKSVRFVETLLKKGFSLNEALEMAEIDETTYNSYKTA